MAELVALTGATGFIGTALVEALTASGTSVRALSRTPASSSTHLTWVPGNLDSPPALQALVDGADAVIHCAGVVRGKSEADFLNVNERGTARLLAACRQQPMARRFLLLSSLAAREPTLSWYAASKHRAEQLLDTDDSELSCAIFRPTAVYGPGDREIRPLLQGLKLGWLPVPNADTRFSLIHVNDLIAAILKWVLIPQPLRGIYELDDGSVNGYNWETLIELARQIWGRSVIKIPVPLTLLNMLALTNLGLARLLHYSPMLTPGKVREITHPDWICDNTAVTAALDWRPYTTLADAMRSPELLQL